MTTRTRTPEASPLLLPAAKSPYAAVQHFDLSGEPVQLLPRRWNPHRVRDPRALRGIILHAWDTPVGTRAIHRSRFGEPMALARRTLATPYTIAAGVTQHGGEPMTVLAHPVERYTNASDAACGEWLAVGVMGRFAFDDADEEALGGREHTPETPALILAVGAAIDLAVRLLNGGGQDLDRGPLSLITHRQAVNGIGDHRECPGEAVVRMAMMSEAVRHGLVLPKPEMVLVPRWGRPWPDHWRRYLPTFAAPSSSTPTPTPVPAPRLVAAKTTVDLPPPPVLTDRDDPRGGAIS